MNTRKPLPVSSVKRFASSAEVSILVEDILLLKVVQSLAVIQPNVEPFAVLQVSALPTTERPLPVRSLNVSPPITKFPVFTVPK